MASAATWPEDARILARAWAVVERSFWASFVFAILIVGVGSLFDLKGWSDTGGGNAVFSGVNWAAGYVLLAEMLRSSKLFPKGQRRGAGSYILYSLLAQTAILLGFFALILPAIVLLVRWLPAPAILLAEGTSITGSLGEAWRRTRGAFNEIAVAGLACVGLLIAGGLAYGFTELLGPAGRVVAIFVANLCLAGCLLLWTALSVAVFDLSKPAAS